MSSIDQQVATEVQSLDLEQLRARYRELYGEDSRGGAAYLRTKVAYALLTRHAREEAEREEALNQDPTEPLEEPDTERVVDHLAIAQAAEARRDFAEAEEQYHLAATNNARTEEEGLALRKKANECRDAVEAQEDEALALAWAKEQQALVAAAQEAEREGDLVLAAKRWQGVAKMGGAESQMATARATELTALAAMADAARTVTLPANEGKKPEAPAPAASGKPAKPRDPRLPPPGVTVAPLHGPPDLRASFREDGTAVVVQVPRDRPELGGKLFDTVSALAKAVVGRNTNGYWWFGFKKPWGESAAEMKRPEEEPRDRADPELATLKDKEALQDVVGVIANAPATAPRPLAPDLEEVNRVALQRARQRSGPLVDEPGSGSSPPLTQAERAQNAASERKGLELARTFEQREAREDEMVESFQRYTILEVAEETAATPEEMIKRAHAIARRRLSLLHFEITRVYDELEDAVAALS